MSSEPENAIMLDWSETRADPVRAIRSSFSADPAAAASMRRASAQSNRGGARVSVDDKAMINCRADVNQLLPLKYRWAWEKYLAGLQQPLDADRSFDAGRYRAVEIEGRADRGRAARDQAQSRILRRLRKPGRQQHRAGDLSPSHQPRMPAISAAPGLRGGGAHPYLPIYRREPRTG